MPLSVPQLTPAATLGPARTATASGTLGFQVLLAWTTDRRDGTTRWSTNCPARCASAPLAQGRTNPATSAQSARCRAAVAPRSSGYRTASTPGDQAPPPAGAADCHAPLTAPG